MSSDEQTQALLQRILERLEDANGRLDEVAERDRRV
jgi:hypothetical protein